MKTKNIQMVVFDMAGTTVNEDNLVYKTLLKSINEAGFELTLENVLEQGAGKEKREAIRSVLLIYTGLADESLVSKIYDDFIDSLTKAYAVADLLPQPNVLELFAELKERNIITILNTGYDRNTATAIIDKLGWQKGLEFDALITASDVAKNRPDPDMIALAMQQFNIDDSERVVKVGDSTIDVLEGKNAGCGLTIGITTGAHTAEKLQTANPDYIIDNLMELAKLIN
jgi:phosphonatase-like hydrolase